MKLNAALAKNSRRSASNNSTGYCYVDWDQVGPILRTSVYEQRMRAIDEDSLNLLSEYLARASKCFGDVLEGKEAAKRLHFIGPILVCVCSLVNGVEILVEEDLRGNIVRANGHFEFMIRKGGKVVCIVEAKKNDMEQGMAQDLVGCEVAAEVEQLNVVYGIVTTYYQWRILRSQNDVIERDDCNIALTRNGPDMDSLRRITGKIYAILTDE
jgi:predicted type IV restriction endonuclease